MGVWLKFEHTLQNGIGGYIWSLTLFVHEINRLRRLMQGKLQQPGDFQNRPILQRSSASQMEGSFIHSQRPKGAQQLERGRHEI